MLKCISIELFRTRGSRRCSEYALVDTLMFMTSATQDWKTLFDQDKFGKYTFPRLSVVIPTFNNAHSIAVTLESILTQEYPDLEVIVVDAASKDRTIEVVKSFYDKRIKIASVTAYCRYEMFNKGCSLATGDYINFLLPGDFYIHRLVSMTVMGEAIDQKTPHLLFGGCLLRDGRSDPKVLFRPLSLELMRKGKQPTSLQSCWFQLDTLKDLGKFHENYHRRGGFDLLCRYVSNRSLRSVGIRRVLTDFNLAAADQKMILDHFFGSILAIWRHFGLFSLITWIFYQRDIERWFRLLGRKVKIAFLGK